MKTFRWGLIGFAAIIILAQLILTDYDDLSWSNNASNYLGVISMCCVIISMIYSFRYDKKREEK